MVTAEHKVEAIETGLYGGLLIDIEFIDGVCRHGNSGCEFRARGGGLGIRFRAACIKAAFEAEFVTE